MNRREVLSTAAELIDGQRAKDYGDAAENFENIAKVWSVILGNEVSSKQVALCMLGVKVCRLAKTLDHLDSWIDAAGYIALGGEIATQSEGEKA